jgi:PAS domain S-box-containing protein
MSIRSKTSLGVALACAMIFLSMVYSNISTSKFIESTGWLVRTLEVRGQIEKLSTLFATAQNNMRGYHMTDQPYYYDLHLRAKQDLLQTLEDLRQLTKDNRIQQTQLDIVASLMNSKIALWDQSVESRRTKGWRYIQDQLKGTETKNQDTTLFAAVDALKNEEERQLAAYFEDTRRKGSHSKTVVSLGSLLALGLIGIAAFLVYRDSRRRELAEEDIDRFFTLSLDLLCISGMDGYFKRLSPSYEATLGYSLKELYSRPITDFVHPDDVQRTNDEIAAQMNGSKVLSFENRFRCKDGSYRILSWKSVPVGQCMYAVARDVTQQKKYEADLMVAREEAQKADIAKSAFLANMSHEIRTPLNGVVGMSDLLARTALDPRQKDYVGAIRNSSEILLKIVNEVLDFSKLEAGRGQLEKIDFDLRHLIESRLHLIEVLALEKGLKLETSIDPKIPRILRGDSGKIGQVLLNFLTNAVKFTDHGKITLDVEGRVLSQKVCRLKFSVRDSGIGMSSEQTARLFQPFVQADSSTARKYGGTGLGLSISKRFVEIMHGDLGIESHPGQGSIFWFTVDLEVSSLETVASSEIGFPYAELKPLDDDSAARRKSIRILVAEDNHTNQMIVMNMIGILGYSVFLAENGEQAVKFFAESAVDLILMDQHMPVMDGIEASRRIRQLESASGSRRRVPIIAFTATVLQQNQKEEFKGLMDDFILKPVTIEVLETVLGSWERRLPAAETLQA